MYYYRVNDVICCSWTPLDMPEATPEEQENVRVFLFERPLAASRAHFLVNHEALLTTGDFAFSKISAMAIIETLYYFLLPEIEGGREHISRYEELIQPDKDVE